MKTAVVVFSLTGNTLFAAERIARSLGAELYRLETVEEYPRSGLKKFFHGGKSALKKECPALKPCGFDAESFDRVILGTPVWAGTFAPPLRSFIEQYGPALAGKRFAAFACSAGGGAEKAIGRLKEALGIESFDAKLSLIDPKDKTKDSNDKLIGDFCDALEG